MNTSALRRLFTPLVALLLLAACTEDPKSPAGFRLPDGDVARGKGVFVARGCIACHLVPGMDFPPPHPPGGITPVTIGGESPIAKTDGELVTSILIPTHRVAPQVAAELEAKGMKTPMPSYQEVLTVRELIDVVAFLQSRYQVGGSIQAVAR